ncbi:MAG: lipocalin family protein [Bacteroidota bacterium]
MSNDTFAPIPSNTIDAASGNSGSILGTWYLVELYAQDGSLLPLTQCEKKINATFRSNGQCYHERYDIVESSCILIEEYACDYVFEQDIITSTRADGSTTKSIVKFVGEKNLEVYNNLGDKIALYKRI